MNGKGSVWEAAQYGLLGPGKRMRPLLALMAADACGADPEKALPAACAIEMVHAFSLIHDDLPCMDDDDLRRGRPTVHKVHGEAVALLAGDLLLSQAFAQLSHPDLTRELARATTLMIEGQGMDIDEAAARTPERLDELNAKKTGALIICALRMGGIVAGANEVQLLSLTGYGKALGLAFQMTDDLLDGEGEHNEKRIAELIQEAIAALLEPFGTRAEPLRELAQSIIGRTV